MFIAVAVWEKKMCMLEMKVAAKKMNYFFRAGQLLSQMIYFLFLHSKEFDVCRWIM